MPACPQLELPRLAEAPRSGTAGGAFPPQPVLCRREGWQLSLPAAEPTSSSWNQGREAPQAAS